MKGGLRVLAWEVLELGSLREGEGMKFPALVSFSVFCSGGLGALGKKALPFCFLERELP